MSRWHLLALDTVGKAVWAAYTHNSWLLFSLCGFWAIPIGPSSVPSSVLQFPSDFPVVARGRQIYWGLNRMQIMCSGSLDSLSGLQDCLISVCELFVSLRMIWDLGFWYFLPSSIAETNNNNNPTYVNRVDWCMPEWWRLLMIFTPPYKSWLSI